MRQAPRTSSFGQAARLCNGWRSPLLEPVEQRILFASLPNPLVNDPTLDATGADTQSETSTIAFGNTIVVAYQDDGSSVSSPNQFDGYSRSTDEGVTFQDMGALPYDSDTSDGTAGDAGAPALARDGVSGRIYLATLNTFASDLVGVQLFRSDNGAASFQLSVNAMPGFVIGSGDFLDEPGVAVDNGSGPRQGNVYVVGRNFPGTGAGARAAGVYLSRSANGGASFSAAQQVVNDTTCRGTTVAVGADHSVYVFWFDSAPSPRINVRRSMDGGQTFGPTTTVAALQNASSLGDLGLAFRTSSFPQVAVNPVTGALYVAYADHGPGADRGDILLVQSTDSGASWSTPLRINNDTTTNDQFQPGIAVTPDGTRLFVSWYDRRLDPANIAIDTFAVTATISGSSLSFGPQLRLTNQSFAPANGVDPVADARYRGEYDTAAADNNFFYYSWSDDRDDSLARNTKQQNVRFARIPVNGAAGPIVYINRPLGSTMPVSSLQFDFNQPMNPSSFSLSDVAAFTDPHGNNLLGALTGFSWVDADTLQINFATQVIGGTYAIALRPSILAASGGAAPLDQNVNGVAGESVADQYLGAFSIDRGFGPDASKYTASATPFENIDLLEGGPNVVKLIDGQDDFVAALPLGANTFNFYGTTYSGASSLYVSTNGLLSLGTGFGNFFNQDLTTTPALPTIAPMWDDWMTDFDATGEINSCVLYKFDTANNRLIIEWSHVVERDVGPTSATFQAILQLNTGSAAGKIVFNYPDLDVGDTRADNGASSTIGIKAAGTQPATGGNRLLVAMNTGSSPYVNSGRAILIQSDVTAPAVVGSPAFQYLTGPQSLSLVFSENVGDSLTAGDFTIQNLTTGSSIPSSAVNVVYNGATNAATLTFPGLPRGILPDGNYHVTLASAGISDFSGNTLGADANLDFFFLAADANHDKKVDTLDFNALAANFGGSNKNYSQADFNYDGVVDTLDFNALAGNFGKTLPDQASRAIASQPGAALASEATSAMPFSITQIASAHSHISDLLDEENGAEVKPSFRQRALGEFSGSSHIR